VVELFAAGLEGVSVHRAQLPVRGLEIHQVVEAIDQLADLRVAANQLIGGAGIALCGLHPGIFASRAIRFSRAIQSGHARRNMVFPTN
jgi:hypothetical protein